MSSSDTVETENIQIDADHKEEIEYTEISQNEQTTVQEYSFFRRVKDRLIQYGIAIKKTTISVWKSFIKLFKKKKNDQVIIEERNLNVVKEEEEIKEDI
ncbi:hypothetical protein GVAV_000212 [Gurleya vavrai]